MPYKDKKQGRAHKRAYYAAHKEQELARCKAYRETHKEERRARKKAWCEAHKEKKRAYDKAWHGAHREKMLVDHKTYYAAHKDELKDAYLRREYGITLEQYRAMFEAQAGACAICGKPENGRVLAIDHNHETGEVRGLLCGTCNLALGVVEHYLPGALAYLAKYAPCHELVQ